MWVTPLLDGFAQDREGLVTVPGRAEDPGPGQLHGAEAHAAEDEVRSSASLRMPPGALLAMSIISISNVAVAILMLAR